MMPRTILPVSLVLALLGSARGDEPKKADDAPKAAEPGTLIVIDAAGKEHKLKSWKFTAGIRRLTWAGTGAATPQAFVLREDNSTSYVDGVLTLVPLDRIRAIDFNGEKETLTVRVATSAKPEQDLVLTGSTEFDRINKLSIDAEVDKGDLGVAEVRFSGGVTKGIRGVRFPPPKLPAEAKDGRPAAFTYGDRKGKYVANLTDLQALYRTNDGEVLSPLLFFKKTIKLDMAKLKKVVPNKEESTKTAPVWQLTLKSGGDDEALTLLLAVDLDGKPGRLEGLLGRVPAGYKVFPADNVQLLNELEFDVKKEAAEAKPKPDADKDK